MGELEGWSQSQMGGGGGGSNRLLPNWLLPNASPLIKSLDSERWLKAEERTAELITCIQPNQPSEARRNAVADYVHRLIMKCFPCQVFTFGSVPLKTYLPDGDIDLTAFSNNPNLKDSWASEVRDLLETEEMNENAEFHVKEVQYIQAEVKIIKCLVENIVVDISFNQLGGLCTLCFLEEVDKLINQNHLFKRSIILIKAWCYYESHILGAHHGLISTYALETLVLYIFHVFNNSFAGPLEVLYRFLEFFSIFDWDNFCVSLWGPVPINSLPDVTVEAPRKDSGELLLNKVFLDARSFVFAVFPGGRDNQGQPFLSKHFNIIDPLRVSNNLGQSVSEGNFFRIRSAFVFGAKKLARLLYCPNENLVAEVNQFFTNTWDRHGNGIRPDAPLTDSLVLKFSTDSSSKKSDNHSTNSQNAPKVGAVLWAPYNQNQKSNGNPNSSRASGSIANKGQRNFKPGHLVNDIQRSPFARTRLSPELTDTYKYVPFQGTITHNPEKNQTPPDTHPGLKLTEVVADEKNGAKVDLDEEIKDKKDREESPGKKGKDGNLSRKVSGSMKNNEQRLQATWQLPVIVPLEEEKKQKGPEVGAIMNNHEQRVQATGQLPVIDPLTKENRQKDYKEDVDAIFNPNEDPIVLQGLAHMKIPLQKLVMATNNFSKEYLIAKGGFGMVYKAQNEHGPIAVKKLDPRFGQGDREFMMEIAMLSAYTHKNLVSLVGFCNEGDEKILVYKHESNGSLDQHIHRKDLRWIQRLQICLDVAQGLKYLHNDIGTQHRILHRDMKSANILLDENFNAKISDFGLSKIAFANVPCTVLISKVCGTPGYVDPEYYKHGILTQKSDVYSFGVVMFEVLCGKLVGVSKHLDEPFSAELPKNCYEEGTLDDIIDSDLRNQMNSASLSMFSGIAHQCLKCRGRDRPTMSLVVEELKKALVCQQVVSPG